MTSRSLRPLPNRTRKTPSSARMSGVCPCRDSLRTTTVSSRASACSSLVAAALCLAISGLTVAPWASPRPGAPPVARPRSSPNGRQGVVEQLESLLLEDFQQEFECLFVEESYSFYPFDLILPCTSDGLSLCDDVRLHDYVAPSSPDAKGVRRKPWAVMWQLPSMALLVIGGPATRERDPRRG